MVEWLVESRLIKERHDGNRITTVYWYSSEPTARKYEAGPEDRSKLQLITLVPFKFLDVLSTPPHSSLHRHELGFRIVWACEAFTVGLKPEKPKIETLRSEHGSQGSAEPEVGAITDYIRVGALPVIVSKEAFCRLLQGHPITKV